MRCLHCNQKLAFYMRLMGRHFCGDAHKKAYHRDRDRLVVEALQQTQHLIRGALLPEMEEEGSWRQSSAC